MRGRLVETWILLKSDPRKAGALGVLGLVLLVLVLKALVLGGPRRASGASTSGSENEVGDRGLSAITLDELRVEGPIIEVPAPRGVARNVFVFDEGAFPPPAQSAPSSQVEPKSGSEAAESPREDRLSRAEKIERDVREEAGALRVKSILMGPNPLAVIESGARGHRSQHTLRIGDVHEGFTLVSIEAARVVMEKHGVRVELER
jgi:hypothetical protein